MKISGIHHAKNIARIKTTYYHIGTVFLNHHLKSLVSRCSLISAGSLASARSNDLQKQLSESQPMHQIAIWRFSTQLPFLRFPTTFLFRDNQHLMNLPRPLKHLFVFPPSYFPTSNGKSNWFGELCLFYLSNCLFVYRLEWNFTASDNKNTV